MITRYAAQVFILILLTTALLFAQSSPNCFLEDYYPKYIAAPPYVDKTKVTTTEDVTVTIDGTDTLGRVSYYVFGNALAVWIGNVIDDPVLLSHLQQLSPTLIRYPGGSWSDLFFWDGVPSDIPDSLYDGTTYSYSTGTATKSKFWPQSGTSSWPTTLNSYYNLRDQMGGTEGLITINYGYARYGLSADPAAQAAHHAANWVRYDNGRTAFWEIGNENAGAWECGWMIDTATNLDGQPKIITGELYAKHFKIFADSMKAAAAELGLTIYIGGQILQFDGSTSSNIPDRTWNADFFREVGDTVDFYVIHNYFGETSLNIKNQVTFAINRFNTANSFVQQDIVNKNASLKPITMTEWNCGGPDNAKTSIANGLQAVVLFSEMIKNNYGMSCRWLIANSETDGMFYYTSSPSYPLWNPRPDFYYIYYLQRFVGDHTINTSVTASPAYSDLLAYATKFSSGHTGVVVVNKGTTSKTVRLTPSGYDVGDRFYIYSLTGINTTTWPQGVIVNDSIPTGSAWGPLDNLANIGAWAYPNEGTIKFTSPASSVQYVLLEPISTAIENENTSLLPDEFKLHQNYPNPFNPQTTISYYLPQTGNVTLKVYDLMGREVAAILNNERQTPGSHKILFDATNLSSGVYFYKLKMENILRTMKMIILK